MPKLKSKSGAKKRFRLTASGKVKMPQNHFLRNFQDFGIRMEVFNLLDISNTINHLWVSDINNQEYAVPNFLTPRLVNLRITGKF